MPTRYLVPLALLVALPACKFELPSFLARDVDSALSYAPSDVVLRADLPPHDRSELEILFEGSPQTISWRDRRGLNIIFIRTSAPPPNDSGETCASVPSCASRQAKLVSDVSLQHYRRKPDDVYWEFMGLHVNLPLFCENALYTVRLGEWSLTDADEDGVGEVTYAERFMCDMGEATLVHKVHIHSEGDAYTLQSEPYAPGETPSFKVNPTSEAWKPQHLEHAKKIWGHTITLAEL